MSRFDEIDTELERRSRDFSGSGQNHKKARTLAVTAVELSHIHKQRESEFEDVLGAKHQYPVILSLRGTQSLLSIYMLVKNHQYQSAFRDLRFLYETYCTIRRLNKDDEIAEQVALELKQNLEAEDDYAEDGESEPEPIEKLHTIRREAKNEAKEWTDGLYDYLSNRSTHPIRIDGIGLDGSHNENEEKQVLTLTLQLSFGLTNEIIKIYSDTPAEQMVYEECEPILIEIYDALDGELPLFITEKY